MSHPLDLLGPDHRSALIGEPFPDRIEPQLAVLTDDYFSDPDWIFERKLDGVRCIVYRKDGDVRLRSRNDNDMTNTYPEIAEALPGGPDCVADGEIVAFDGQTSSFSRLQGRIGIDDPDRARRSGIAIYLYLFDLIHFDGYSLAPLPLRRRKALLKAALTYSNRIRFSAHRNTEGKAWLEQACERGWEGLIAKRANAPYQFKRSRDWLKFKCAQGQEMVIGGWTDPEGSRIGFGALLLGYYDQGSLRYAGRVGTGFDQALLTSLHDKLTALETATPPFADPPDAPGLHWAEPSLVGEIGFTEWTGSGKLRHPRFKGLRHDKTAAEVVRESP